MNITRNAGRYKQHMFKSVRQMVCEWLQYRLLLPRELRSAKRAFHTKCPDGENCASGALAVITQRLALYFGCIAWDAPNELHH